MFIADVKDYDYAVIENFSDLRKFMDKPTVVEFDTLSPRQFNESEFKDKFHVVFMGFATSSEKELFDFWAGSGYQKTRGFSDKELMQFAKEVSATGKQNKLECDEYGYKFVNIHGFKRHSPTSIYASQVWEYLFGEKKEINLATKTKFDE